MIPLKLSIEGLYSYQDRQTIDFNELTNVGLFGVFGATGSGKSTILEAITFALYGNIERMNTVNRAYNMMNLKSNRMYVSFDFVNFEDKTYRAVRELSRNSKNFEDVKPKAKSVIFYELDGENAIPLEDQNAEEIVGLSYENFKRTIIIPQGQFKEFLELGPTERTKMMKEIFGLKRFDLAEETSKLRNANETVRNQYIGELNVYENVSEELKSLKEAELKEKQNIFVELEKKYITQQELVLKQSKLKEQFESLNSKRADFAIKKEQENEFKALELKIRRFEQVNSVFKNTLELLSKYNNEKKSIENNLENQNKILLNLKVKIEGIVNEKKELKPLYDILEVEHKKLEELSNVLKINQLNAELNHLDTRQKKGLSTVNDKKVSLEELKMKSKALNKEIKELESNKVDFSILMSIDNWYISNNNFKNVIEKQKLDIKELNAKIAKNEEDFSLLDVTNSDFQKFYDDKNLKINKLRTDVLQQITQLKVQQKLSVYAENLKNGEACLLCGSLEHPNIIHAEDVSSDLDKIQANLIDLENQIKENNQNFMLAKQLVDNKIQLKTDLNSKEKDLNKLIEDFKIHQNNFKWDKFDSKDETKFIAVKETTKQLEELLKEKRKLVEDQLKNIELAQNELTRYENVLQDFNHKMTALKSKIATLTEGLKYVDLAHFDESLTEEKIGLKREKLNTSKKRYEQLIEDFNTENLKISALESEIKQINIQSDKLSKDISLLKENIEELLVKHDLESVDEVMDILSWQVDLETKKKDIDSFKVSFEALRTHINELEAQLKDKVFDEKVFILLEDELQSSKNTFEEINKQVIALRTELKSVKDQLLKKQEIAQKLEQVQKRGDNLNKLSNLFRSAGFVDYVSSIYLVQLCKHANIRFQRMTRNQLSLQVNKSNDFEIIDYLNDGKSRSVRTLSGGQAFQVSLSLALALAESVQSQAKAQKNFFFIDEGFGTQDAESVQLVFETLLDLNKENKIVGIISHVEELKERMPIAISVIKDEQKGSLIQLG